MNLNIKKLRLLENKSQKEIANELGLTQGTYSNYENGVTEPPLQTLIEIANHHQVSIDYLVGRQFQNEFGYLTNQDRNFFREYLKLEESQKAKIITYTAFVSAEV